MQRPYVFFMKIWHSFRLEKSILTEKLRKPVQIQLIVLVAKRVFLLAI